MEQYRRGFITMVTLVLFLIIGGTLLHNWGHYTLENDPITMLESLEYVTQTITTVGYGQEAGWTHPFMYVLAITLQLAGITIVFLSIPVVVTPWLENRLETQPPTKYKGPTDHYLITNYSSSLDNLIDELRRRDKPYVILEEDNEKARDLYSKDYCVIKGNARNPDHLENAKLTDASSVILEGTDQRNASVALVIHEVFNKQGIEPAKTIAIARKTDRAIQLQQAGVEEVIYPRKVIGEALAEKILTGSSTSLDFEMLPNFEIREYPILNHHPLVNKRLQSTSLNSKFGVNPIGLWRTGQFKSPSSHLELRLNDVMIVAGTSESLNQLDDFLESRSRWQKGSSDQNVVIIGFGQEGQAANKILKENGITPTVVNDIDLEDVDVTGDGMNEETLRKVNIEEADAVLVTISLDDESVMVSLLVDRLNPEAELLVQVRTSPIVESAYRSGASYVQSLDQVTSRLLVAHLFGENLVDFDLNMEFVRTDTGDLASKSLGEADLVHNYGVIPVGVKRDGESLDCEGRDFEFQSEDEILLVGVDNAIETLCGDYNLNRLGIDENSESKNDN